MSSSTRTSFAARFRAVAGERIAKVVAALDAGDLEEAGREIHGLKGEARVVGFEPIAQIAHELESRLAEGAPRAAIDEGIALIERALPLEPHVAPPGMDAFLGRKTEEAHSPASPSPEEAPIAEPLAWVASRAADSFLRVDMGALGKLTRSVSAVRATERDLLTLIDLLANPDQDPRERARRGLALARQIAFDHRQRTDLLTDDLRRLRTVPLGQLFEPFPRAVAQLGAQLGKEVHVVISGADVEVDRQVLDVVTDPLLHLVRNAVDHGIETPDERRAHGKPAVGRLKLSARATSGAVEIEIEDDGAGIDVEAVLASGASVDSDEALLDALCRHGFSTRTHVSDVSGRGIGLDVVKRRIESVGGRLALRTRRGHGTCFSLELPTTMVLGSMVCVEVEDARYALAPHEVVQVLDAREVGSGRAGKGPIVRLDGRAVPLFDLGALTERTSEPIPRARVVVVRHGEREIAVGVDRFKGTRSVSEQRLDPFLEGIELIRSVAVLADGELAVALDAAELIRRADDFLGNAPRPRRAPEPRTVRSRRVLVVDDSELTRDLVVATLREMGLEVLEAVNGEGALTQLESEQVGLIVTDLDMPVVDGFELIRRVRQSGRGRIPIVVLSTRGDQADVRRASELGADAYLVKSRLELEHLRRVVRRYIEADP